jgi:hypothetical protein
MGEGRIEIVSLFFIFLSRRPSPSLSLPSLLFASLGNGSERERVVEKVADKTEKVVSEKVAEAARKSAQEAIEVHRGTQGGC